MWTVPVADRIESEMPKKPSRVIGARAPSKMLTKFKDNPKADWDISDIKTACRQLGLTCTAPTRGTHHKVSSPHLDGILIIPHKKPIKFHILGLS